MHGFGAAFGGTAFRLGRTITILHFQPGQVASGPDHYCDVHCKDTSTNWGCMKLPSKKAPLHDNLLTGCQSQKSATKEHKIAIVQLAANTNLDAFPQKEDYRHMIWILPLLSSLSLLTMHIDCAKIPQLSLCEGTNLQKHEKVTIKLCTPNEWQCDQNVVTVWTITIIRYDSGKKGLFR